MIIWMIIGYMFLYIHRPFEVWPMFAAIRLELLYMILLTLVWLASTKSLTLNRLTLAIIFFAATMLLSWATSDYVNEENITLSNWLKLLPFYLIIITSVRDEQDLKKLLKGFLFVMFIYMSHSLLEFMNGRHVYRMGIARMVGVGEALSDPNSFAASVIYALPMTLPIWSVRTTKKVTYGIICYWLLSLICILLTGSRGGMLGLIALGLCMILATRRRGLALLIILIASPIAWLSLSEDLQNRYLTIIDDSRGPDNAQASKDSRRLLFLKAVDLWEERPLLGYGPGTFAEVSQTGMAAHSLYGEVLAELGIVGVIALLMMIIFILLNYIEARQLLRKNLHLSSKLPFNYLVIRSVMFTLILLLVLGFAGHNLYRFTWLWYAAFQAIALKFLPSEIEQNRWDYEHDDALLTDEHELVNTPNILNPAMM